MAERGSGDMADAADSAAVEQPVGTTATRVICTITGLLSAVLGLIFLTGGALLAWLGGSLYYVCAGAVLFAAGIAMVRRRLLGPWLYLLVYGATIPWAIWEVGFAFWPLVARVFAPTILLIAMLAALAGLTSHRAYRRGALGGMAIAAVAVVATVLSAFQPHGVTRASAGRFVDTARIGRPSDWNVWGRDAGGTRYMAAAQIDKTNVHDLEVAWIFRTGTKLSGTAVDANTPIQIGNTLFACTAYNTVFALDADTGKRRWSFDPKASAPRQQRCRGVAYYKSAKLTGACAERIVLTTIDARLFELDARTGSPCPQFGKSGQLSLWDGMGEIDAGWYFPTSAPTVARGLIITGARVSDNMKVGEPSGVVRAYSAETGALIWAWDIGRSAADARSAGAFTRGTPNVWTTMVVDEALGLVYLPTGNATPDHVGMHRSAASDRYSSSLVALDIATGREAWTYQMVHHDIWDFDMAAQPSLYDMPDGRGGRMPAIVQMTKHGQIFVLDRRTGRPVTRVDEVAAPRGQIPGERYSPTQPMSVGMPTIGATPLTETDMWGATPVDQMLCRIGFRRMRFDGPFTPPGTDRTLNWPGYYGGLNWGGAAIDPARDLLIVNDIRIGQSLQLIPRAEERRYIDGKMGRYSPQAGTPFGFVKSNFMSVLNVPCQAPPYGTMTAIDLRTRKVAWQVPLGTVRDTGPLGIGMGLAIPIGLPTVGGPAATAGGITFYAGTQDFYLRALDSDTGREVWRGRLPVGADATPLTYVSPASGRQYVVISAGGARESPKTGDYIVAYRLRR